MGILDGWQFCPRCGGRTAPGDGNIVCAECGFVVWANSVPAVQALVERDAKLLLVRRAVEPRIGMWDLPGGILLEGEHPEDGLRRELKEETNLDVELGSFLGVWLDPYAGRTVLCLTYEATPVGGIERPADDVAAIEWFARDELPTEGEFAFASHRDVVAMWRSRHARS
jgi:ADP-ribose pyrophosphatase YjhB (NUDIX family)